MQRNWDGRGALPGAVAPLASGDPVATRILCVHPCSSDSLDEAILRGGSASSEVEMAASDMESPEATPRFVQTLPTIPSLENMSQVGAPEILSPPCTTQ